MHLSWSGIRLMVLAVAATASGYLWRAAFEPSSQAPTIIRLAPPALRPAIPAGTVSSPQPTRRVTANHRPASVVARRITQRSTQDVASAATPTPQTYAPASRPATPKPPPKPAPKPKPPATPPPAQSPAPEAAPATPPAPAPTGAPEHQPNQGDDSGKPGWGHGDQNHDHGGPPGDKPGK
jgi:outer membrane biosynthesis protein TonB